MWDTQSIVNSNCCGGTDFNQMQKAFVLIEERTILGQDKVIIVNYCNRKNPENSLAYRTRCLFLSYAQGGVSRLSVALPYSAT